MTSIQTFKSICSKPCRSFCSISGRFPCWNQIFRRRSVVYSVLVCKAFDTCEHRKSCWIRPVVALTTCETYF